MSNSDWNTNLTWVPDVEFKTRVRDESIEGDNPFRWQTVTSKDLFKNKRVVVFSLPGAFTPTCSSTHLPDFERLYDDIIAAGIDEVYCLSVNDAFVMYQWSKNLGVSKVKMLPDGNCQFTYLMGMMVKKENLGFGNRSWRYAMVVNDMKIEQMFVEPGFSHNCETDPFEVSSAQNVLSWLTSE